MLVSGIMEILFKNHLLLQYGVYVSLQRMLWYLSLKKPNCVKQAALFTMPHEILCMIEEEAF